jgi:hypothetical protein
LRILSFQGSDGVSPTAENTVKTGGVLSRFDTDAITPPKGGGKGRMETGTRIVLTRRECSSPRDNRNIKNRLGKRLVFELIRPNPAKSGIKKLKLLWTIGQSKLLNPQLCITSKRSEDGSTFPRDHRKSRSAEHQLGANRVSVKERFQSSPTHFPKTEFCGDSRVPTYSSPCGGRGMHARHSFLSLISRAFRRFLWTRRIETAPIKSNRKFLKSWPIKT